MEASTEGLGFTAAVLAWPGGCNFFCEGIDGSGDSVIHDAEVVQRHPHGPMAAAVFQAGDAIDQDARGGGVFCVAGIHQPANRLALLREKGVEEGAISGA